MAFAVDRIDHVVLNCRDVDGTADWYVRVLGMRREVFADDGVPWYSATRRSTSAPAERRTGRPAL